MGDLLGKFTDWSGITNIKGKEEAGKVGREAAELQADYQQQGLDYLKAQDELPQELRQESMQQYANLFDPSNSRSTLNNLKKSATYKGIMSTLGGGEEAILRNQAATGGFRSGTTQDNLGRYAAELEQQALAQAFQQQAGGLGNLMNTQGNSQAIAQMTGGVGQTLGQGLVAEQQGLVAGQEDMRNFAQNERQYGHDVGMSFLGGMGK